MDFRVVITTIQGPTPSVRSTAGIMASPNSPVFILGDSKGPQAYDLDNTKLLTIRDQEETGFKLVTHLPKGHYARKNIGYLVAIREGAKSLFETDDDNFPKENWIKKELKQTAMPLTGNGWCNVYRYFSNEPIWPRGFPLQHIKDDPSYIQEGAMHTGDFPVQQLLADGSPDVDAVWRMVFGQEVFFNEHPPVALSEGLWCPFNSQATWWWPKAYRFLYLPSYCSFRMTDIWRGLIAQRCLWAEGFKLLFHHPEMQQERNEHSLIKDFEDEITGYQHNACIAESLSSLDLKSGKQAENLYLCIESLVRKGWIGREELPLVEAWNSDLDQVILNSP